MALLASCWLIIEYFIIPNGFLKWYYLSFYIHPFFLIFCQVFLWLKELQNLLFLFFCFLFKITCYANSFIFRFMKRVAVIILFFIRPTKIEVFYDVINEEISETIIKNSELIVRSTCVSFFELDSDFRVVSGFEKKEETGWYVEFKDSWLNEFLNSDYYNSSLFSCDSDIISDQESTCETENSDVNFNHEGIISDETSLLSRSAEIQSFVAFPVPFQQKSLEGLNSFSSLDMLNTSLRIINQEFIDNLEDPEISSPVTNLLFHGSDSPIVTFEEQLVSISVDDEIDSFHRKYAERMRFFDVLYDERLYGMNEISKVNLMSLDSFLSNESPINLSSSKMDTKMIVKSLEYDLELVYVAQACLSWEALHYQYRELEASNSQEHHRLFCNTDVTEKFQKYQILLERFMEEEKSTEGKRNLNHTHRRCQLQVPDAKDEGDISMRGEAISAAELLEAIEKCIKVFWIYVQKDTKKSSWKYKTIFRSRPPVEDPRDLELLYDLSNSLHKKVRFLKDLQWRKKCLLRRKVKPMQQDSETKDVLFTMIDLKLVEKVLKLSVISRSHLIWCHEKLSNIEFREGKLFRGSSTCGLFPCS